MKDFLQHVSFMTTRWAVVEKGAKNLSTVTPDSLLKDGSESGVLNFIEAVQREKCNMLDDYMYYVAPTFPLGSNTQASVCVRYAHRVAWLSLTRFLDAFQTFASDKQPEARGRTAVSVSCVHSTGNAVPPSRPRCHC